MRMVVVSAGKRTAGEVTMALKIVSYSRHPAGNYNETIPRNFILRTAVPPRHLLMLICGAPEKISEFFMSFDIKFSSLTLQNLPK